MIINMVGGGGGIDPDELVKIVGAWPIIKMTAAFPNVTYTSHEEEDTSNWATYSGSGNVSTGGPKSTNDIMLSQNSASVLDAKSYQSYTYYEPNISNYDLSDKATFSIDGDITQIVRDIWFYNTASYFGLDMLGGQSYKFKAKNSTANNKLNYGWVTVPQAYAFKVKKDKTVEYYAYRNFISNSNLPSLLYYHFDYPYTAKYSGSNSGTFEFVIATDRVSLDTPFIDYGSDNSGTNNVKVLGTLTYDGSPFYVTANGTTYDKLVFYRKSNTFYWGFGKDYGSSVQFISAYNILNDLTTNGGTISTRLYTVSKSTTNPTPTNGSALNYTITMFPNKAYDIFKNGGLIARPSS